MSSADVNCQRLKSIVSHFFLHLRCSYVAYVALYLPISILVHLFEGRLGQHLLWVHLCPFILEGNLLFYKVVRLFGYIMDISWIYNVPYSKDNNRDHDNKHFCKSVIIDIFIIDMMCWAVSPQGELSYCRPFSPFFLLHFFWRIWLRIRNMVDFSHSKQNFHIVNQFLHFSCCKNIINISLKDIEDFSFCKGYVGFFSPQEELSYRQPISPSPAERLSHRCSHQRFWRSSAKTKDLFRKKNLHYQYKKTCRFSSGVPFDRTWNTRRNSSMLITP